MLESSKSELRSSKYPQKKPTQTAAPEGVVNVYDINTPLGN